MKAIVLILFSYFLFVPLFCLPGLRISVTEKYLNNFLQVQLPNLLPSTINIPDITKNTTHSYFLANITNIAISNLNLDYLETKISLNPEKNTLALTLSN